MKLKKWIALLLAVSVVFAFTACGSKGTGEDEVVAKIEDTEITAGQLDQFLSLSAYAAGQDLTQLEAQPEYMKFLRKAMLSNMVSYEAMRISLEADKKEIFPETYQTQLDEFMKGANENAGEFLKEKKIDEAMLTYYFNLSFYSMPFNEPAEKAVTDESVKAYYEANKDKYTLEKALGKVSHIVVAEEAVAKEIYDELEAGGDFAKLAAEYGTDTTKDTGGVLGELAEEQSGYDETFMKAAFTLKSDEYSKPVKTSFGYHLIKMENRREAGTLLPFSEVEASIRQDQVTAAYNKVIEDLLKNYKIEYFGDYKDEPVKDPAKPTDKAE